jgi:hypothetical protein
MSGERIVFQERDELSTYVLLVAHMASCLLRYRFQSSTCGVPTMIDIEDSMAAR